MVVTPSSHVAGMSGFFATQSRAASRAFISGCSAMVTMIEFIMDTGTTKFFRKRVTFGMSAGKPLRTLV